MAGSELYFYWRVSEDRAVAAAEALRAWQAALAQAHPRLQVRALWRHDARGVTLMEIYVAPGDIDAELRTELVEHGSAIAARFGGGERKLEAFEPLAP